MKTKRPILLRWPQRLVRAAAWAVLLTFSLNIVTPTLVMARDAERRAEMMAGPKRTQFDDVTDTLIQLEEALQRMNRRLQGGWEFEWQEIANRGGQTPPPAAADRAALRALEDELEAAVPRLESLQGHVRAFFAQTRKHIEDAKLAPEILARHDDSVSEYEASYSQLKSLLHAIKTAKTLDEFKAAVAAGDAFMQAHSSKPKRSTFDPNAPLAFGPGKSNTREPATDAKAMRKALGLPEPTAKMLARQADSKAAPTAAELAETEDAQFTAAIRAKAQELGNNPVAIYNFVRNNVEFMPTYGSIQGADQTLKTLRGNAFDQSSLLIALLRAANVPARYVYGTIEVPIDQVQNWVGGTETPQAALELLGAGGIPNLGLAQGGVIKKARIEHVWVEAFVDFVPSRGAKNIAGDTWVPMDAAFKQYSYTAGIGLTERVAFDSAALAQALASRQTRNDAEGWVQGIDLQLVRQTFDQYSAQVKQVVQSEDPESTLGDLIGKKKIFAQEIATLAPQGPHPIIAVASRSAHIAEAARWKFRYSLDGTRMVERSLPSLAGKLMSMSFRPASARDEDALRSLIPSNADGVEDLPSSIPTSLVLLVPEFVIDGEVVSTSTARSLGTEISTRKGLFIPNQGWQETDNPLATGDYQVVGLDGAGVSRNQLEALQELTRSNQRKLNTNDFAGLTKHRLAGVMLQTGMANYFTQTNAKVRISAAMGGVVSYPLPSYGTLSTQSDVQYWFGMPRNFIPRGILIDMDRMANNIVAKNGDHQKRVAFAQSVGSILSSHEHVVIEELFDDRNSSTPPVAEGVSAVKALALAAAAGQRIYTISDANLSTALSAIALPSDVEREIADAVMAGKKVTTHQSLVSYSGQSTAGYIIIDEATGAGAYKLAGGADGGMAVLKAIGWIMLILLMCIVAALLVWILFFATAALIAGIVAVLAVLAEAGLLTFAVLLNVLLTLDSIADIIKIIRQCEGLVMLQLLMAYFAIMFVDFMMGPVDEILSILKWLATDPLEDRMIDGSCPPTPAQKRRHAFGPRKAESAWMDGAVFA